MTEQQADTEEQKLTTAEVARLCGVTDSAVRQWRRGGKLTATKDKQRGYLFDRAEAEALSSRRAAAEGLVAGSEEGYTSARQRNAAAVLPQELMATIAAQVAEGYKEALRLAEARIAALEAELDAARTPTPAPDQTLTADPGRRPWWRRPLFGRSKGGTTDG